MYNLEYFFICNDGFKLEFLFSAAQSYALWLCVTQSGWKSVDVASSSLELMPLFADYFGSRFDWSCRVGDGVGVGLHLLSGRY